MPLITSRYFGEVQYEKADVFEFPAGMPGFEDHRRFLFIERAHTEPLLFMQSLDDPGLCFIAAPVSTAVLEYALELAPEERELLDLPPEGESSVPDPVGCFGLITSAEGAAPTMNLASPVVLNLRTRKGTQAVRGDARYSLRHPLLAREEVAQCS